MDNPLHRILVAAGIARIYNHLAEGRFAVISAERAELDTETNAANSVRLKELAAPWGFLPGVGVWQDDLPQDSIFMPGIDRESALALGKQFNQDSVLWGVGGQYWLLYTDGSVEGPKSVKDAFHYMDDDEVAESYTNTKGYKWLLDPNKPETQVDVDLPFSGSKEKRGKRYAYSHWFDTSRPGQPFFFWSGNFKFAFAIPPFGFGVHDGAVDEKGHITVSSKGQVMPIGHMAMYLKFYRPGGEAPPRVHHTVIADAWRGLVSKPGLGQVTGGEKIVDKFWIDDKGGLVHHGLYKTHQEYALELLKETEKFKTTGNQNQDMLRAEKVLLERGWIRGQVYSQDGLGLQGTSKAVRTHGAVALSLVPRPRRLYVAGWPGGETSMYTAKDLRRMLGMRCRGNEEAT